MSLTVRFPSGLILTYNSARYLVESASGGYDLYREADKKHWVASIQNSAGCVVEGQTPCSLQPAAPSQVKIVNHTTVVKREKKKGK